MRPSTEARVVEGANRALMVLAALFASVVSGVTGAYVLWQFHTFAGLMTGVGLIILSLAIAVPLQLKKGINEAKDNAVIIVPIVHDAIVGGDRHTDPNADLTPKDIEIPPRAQP